MDSANPLGTGDQGYSYGLRADGMLFKRGTKESGARFNITNKRGTTAFEGYSEGDVIGCGLLLESRSIFFTLNGTYLGVAFKEVNLGLQDQGGLGKASELISMIDGHNEISKH